MSRITLAIFLAIGMAAGCASPPAAPPPAQPEPARARAALATLMVVNRSEHRLTIAYRLPARAAPEVVVGTVPPGSVAEMAPVPAGEPLVLLARNDAGGVLTLPPRSFVMDDEWTWVVAADARFGSLQEGH
ncbi:MAG TPA: hypothetical protein VK929_05885 [Longimicrobiales bacterium]|nr:hypothetical protein [Longimicrobiales bacterium]